MISTCMSSLRLEEGGGGGVCSLSNTPFIFQNLKEGFTPNIKRMQTLARPGPMHISESGIQLINRKQDQPNTI
jgi:hypothetical protein